MSGQKLRWGVLGVSNFAVRKLIPGVRDCQHAVIHGIASRDAGRSREAADQLGIQKSYGSYEELLADPEIDVVYNPLPNHLHVPWSIRALEAGKHVLCEKPVSMTTEDLRTLIGARDRSGRLVAEGFMIRFHPQWLRAKELITSGALGEVRVVSTCFSYFNKNAANVRNISAYGGGGMWDIGCYAVNAARFAFGQEPVRVVGVQDVDPEFGVDRLASGMLEFAGGGQSIFVCSTQLAPYQRVNVIGTKGRVEVEIPFNAVPGEPMRLFIDDGSDVKGSGIRTESVAVCDQYTLEADGFSRAVLGEAPLVNGLEEAFGNAATLEALFRSAASGQWENPARL